MKIKEAKILFEAKLLSSATVFRLKNSNSWKLKFVSVNPVDINLDIETHSGEVRIFKTVNAAVLTAEKIGFEKVTVILSSTANSNP